MLLLLDTISVYPKFVLINNNNSVKSIHILDKNNTKISDIILLKYLEFEKKNNFNQKLTSLFVLTGPGSYTGLRVGIAFMYGLSLSKNIPIYGIPCTDLFIKQIKKNFFIKTLIFIFSGNNQNFICIPKSKQKYKIFKISKELISTKIKFSDYSHFYCNSSFPASLKNLKILRKNIKIFDIIKLFNEELINSSKKEKIINPIYISDNKILNYKIDKNIQIK